MSHAVTRIPAVGCGARQFAGTAAEVQDLTLWPDMVVRASENWMSRSARRPSGAYFADQVPALASNSRCTSPAMSADG